MAGSRLLTFEFSENRGAIMDEDDATLGEKAVTLERLQSLFGLKSAVYL
jgi:hypothetical protein